MNLTKSLKTWVAANCKGLTDQSSDDDFRKAAGMAIATGSLSMEKYAELAKDEDADGASEFGRHLKALGEGIGQLTKMLSEKREEPKQTKEDPKEEPKEKKEAKEEPKQTKSDPPAWHKSIKRMMSIDVPVDEDGNVRVKGAWEQYSTTKSALRYPDATKAGNPHPFAGRPVLDIDGSNRELEESSQLDKAVSGAWAKFQCSIAQKGGSRTLGFQCLPQHDKELIYHALESMNWGGSSVANGDHADIKNRRLAPHEQKAIIDDATSGGVEAAPIVFDDQVIQAPLLYGELFPLVNKVNIDRGRRVEGVATGTVTGAWGGVDDTAITLFVTTAYVTAFDTTIYRWQGSILIGLDFMSDTPIDFGAHVTAQYGERLLEDLDDVIASGNGTTQPEGVINHAGVGTVNFGGATSIGNYESLLFGIAAAEMKPQYASSTVFCGTYTSYQRMKALPLSAADARRLFAGGSTNVGTYMDRRALDFPYKINESLANTQIFFAILARYRMYVRRGLTMRTSQEGATLIRDNEMLIACTARYGGQLERGACAAITTTAPA